MNILTRVNKKTEKGEKRGWITMILNFSPAKISGYNMCPWSNEQCEKFCLNTAGNGFFPVVANARLKRTLLFNENRSYFMQMLLLEIAKAKLNAELEGMQLAIRPNGTSDVIWERIKFEGKSIMEHFPDVIFYDYTKCSVFKRAKYLPENYKLVYSWSGFNKRQCIDHLRAGYNVAIPYMGEIPKTRRGYTCIDGDVDDLRFLDNTPSVVML